MNKFLGHKCIIALTCKSFSMLHQASKWCDSVHSAQSYGPQSAKNLDMKTFSQKTNLLAKK